MIKHHWIVSEYELEMPLTRSHTVMEFDNDIISQYLNQVAVIVYLFYFAGRGAIDIETYQAKF